jgi:two-component system, OmpR family, sensor kinase
MSLRTRLVAALVLVAAIALAGAGVATSVVFSRSQLRQVDDNLNRVASAVEAFALDSSPAALREIERIAPGLFVTRLGADGQVTFAISARAAGDDPVSIDPAELWTDGAPIDDIRHLTVSSTFENDRDRDDGQSRLRVRISPLDDGGALAIGESLHEIDETRRNLVGIEIGVAVAGLVFATLAGIVLVSVGLRPLRRIERAALDIAEGGDLDRKVPGVSDSTEIGRLAHALDVMLGRIREAFATRDETEEELRRSEEQMRRLVADASHELRTPLAAISAYAELFDRGARDRPEDLERAMHGISAETERMRILIEDLLLLARLDEDRPLARERVDLSTIVADAIEAAATVAPEWPISADLPDAAPITGDPTRLRQVIDNLLANVRAHTPAGTNTVVRLRGDATESVLTVSDDGPGMSSDDVARAFERFHRADSSRTRTAGTPAGSGLGLSIVAALVEAHEGTVTLDATPGHGVTVEIRLPIDPPEGPA